ncbi:MAG TPA: carboxymuconolactone decarboxylase family protein [Sphingomicrobium sp.]|nr:carboxymuconolactone decarboxylase family protein [Sphingomicrobium sp.]
MSRLAIPARDDAPAASQPLLDAVGRKLGIIPNMFRLISNSPAGLEGVLGLSGGLGKTLDVKTRERIAIAVAAINGCDYCMSAHTYLGSNLAKLDEAELAANRRGRSNDAKADVAVAFARKVAEMRGKVSDVDVSAVKLAGYTDAQVVEIVLVVAENFLTNLINNVGETDIDFPVVPAKAA